MRKINIYHSVQDAPEVLPRNTVICGDYLAVLRKIPDGSIDAVIIDPPYTDGKTDALPNHKIQTKVDIDLVFIEANRVLKADGFICFFGIMPTVLAWLNAAAARFKFREHITWCKRNTTSPYLDIQRSKEELFLYCKGKPKYYERQAKFEDLKTPALHFGIYELNTIKTTISDLQRRCIDNAYNMRYFSAMPSINCQNNDKQPDYPKSDQQILNSTANDDIWRGEKLDKEVIKNQGSCKYELDKADFESAMKAQKLLHKRGSSNDENIQNLYPFSEVGFKYRSKNWCNVTNVWSFMPKKDRAKSYKKLKKRTKRVYPIWSYLSQNNTKMGKDGENWKHPTVKPVLLLERLIKLILPLPNEDYTPVVLDFFGGTGTTAIAADNLGIDFITAEIIDTYFEIIVERLDKNDQNSVERFGATSHNPEPPKPKFIQQNMFD